MTTAPADTWSAVRRGRSRQRLGWCGHRHQTRDAAKRCADISSSAWRDGSAWAALRNGHAT